MELKRIVVECEADIALVREFWDEVLSRLDDGDIFTQSERNIVEDMASSYGT
jgi:hypothetical protein